MLAVLVSAENGNQAHRGGEVVKRDADALAEKFAGYFTPPPAPVRAAA